MSNVIQIGDRVSYDVNGTRHEGYVLAPVGKQSIVGRPGDPGWFVSDLHEVGTKYAMRASQLTRIPDYERDAGHYR